MRGFILALLICPVFMLSAAGAHDVRANLRHYGLASEQAARNFSERHHLGRNETGAAAAECRQQAGDLQARRQLGVFHDQLEQEENLRDHLHDESCLSHMDSSDRM